MGINFILESQEIFIMKNDTNWRYPCCAIQPRCSLIRSPQACKYINIVASADPLKLLPFRVYTIGPALAIILPIYFDHK